MKTLLLPKNLANDKGGGGYVQPPMLSFSADAPPSPPAPKVKIRRGPEDGPLGATTTLVWGPSTMVSLLDCHF